VSTPSDQQTLEGWWIDAEMAAVFASMRDFVAPIVTGGTPVPPATARVEPDIFEQTYHGMIAEEFIELRGSSPILSPTDMQLIDNWHKLGIPVGLALRSIRQVMTNRRGRRIRSISYCREEVEASFAEMLEGHVGCGGCEQPYCAGSRAA